MVELALNHVRGAAVGVRVPELFGIRKGREEEIVPDRKIGVPPLWGLVAMTMAAGLGMGFLGERLAQRDVAIGIVLALSLGLGLLFLHFYTAFATQATSLLFGAAALGTSAYQLGDTDY